MQNHWVCASHVAMVAAAILCMIAPGAWAAEWIFHEKITASNEHPRQEFGYSVSVSGGYAVVGAKERHNASVGARAGAAYVYCWNGESWDEQDILLPAALYPDSRFGYSSSIDGDLVLVGAPRDQPAGYYSGSAFVYRRNGTEWVEEAKLLASNASSGDRFGRGVSIGGGIGVVGAYYADGNAAASGAAYVFEHGELGWQEQAKLAASDGARDDLFGYTVAVCGDYAIVGAPGDADAGTYTGAAYVFDKTSEGWSQEAKLTAPTPMEDAFFGGAVAICDGLIAVGANGTGLSTYPASAVHVYRYDEGLWLCEATLIGAGGRDFFGNSIGIDGERLLVGAHDGDGAAHESGTAYCFHHNGTQWVKTAQLSAPDGVWADRFGSTVSLDGDVAFVGAYHNREARGAAYVYIIPEPATMSVLAIGALGLLRRRGTRRVAS
jgi:hypothetical protein